MASPNEHTRAEPGEHDKFSFERRQRGSRGSEPLVTVIIQCFNRTTFLEEAIASVTAQSFDGFDAVVFDNGSSPENAQRIQLIAEKYKLSLFRAANNGPSDKIRRVILPEIATKYTTVLHDDDKWKADKLLNAVSALEGEQLDYVFSNKQYIDTRGRLIHNVDGIEAVGADVNYSNLSPEQIVGIGLLRSNPLHWSTLVIRTDLLWREYAKYSLFSRTGDCQFFCHLTNSPHLRGKLLDVRDTLVRIHDDNELSYKAKSPFALMYKRARLVSDDLFFFSEILQLPPEKFALIFHDLLQRSHPAPHLNRNYVDVSFRLLDRYSAAFSHFCKLCYVTAIEMDPQDTHNYLKTEYDIDGDAYAQKLDKSFFVKVCGIPFSFLPNSAINAVQWVLKRMKVL
jgi:glycosyltransferase involved in cell wall biosynthesis